MRNYISYDSENGILFVHKGFSKGEKFKGNIDVWGLVLDLSNKGKIVGLEIINATEYLKDSDIDKKILENLSDIVLNISQSYRAIALSLIFETN